MIPRIRFRQPMCSLAGWYLNSISTRFLDPIGYFKIPAQPTRILGMYILCRICPSHFAGWLIPWTHSYSTVGCCAHRVNFTSNVTCTPKDSHHPPTPLPLVSIGLCPYWQLLGNFLKRQSFCLRPLRSSMILAPRIPCFLDFPDFIRFALSCNKYCNELCKHMNISAQWRCLRL